MIINSQQLEVVLMWVLFSIFVGVALAIDLGVIGKIKEMRTKRSDQKAVSKEKKVRSINDALAWTIVWISLGLIFAGVIYFSMGYEKMLEYITGYTLEKTLSVDNMFVFGAFLIFTAIRMFVQKKEEKIELEKNIAVRALKKIMPVDVEIKTDKFLLRKNGILYATPLLVAIAIVEMTDLVFALDSILSLIGFYGEILLS